MKIKETILTLTAAGAIVLAGVAGATGSASAQEPSATPRATFAKRIEHRNNFLTKVATNLGITLDQLTQAFRSAALQTVDEALANGDITQEQADNAKAKIESGEGLGLGPLMRGAEGRRVRHERVQKLREGIIRSAATALDMTPAELRTDLKSGKSIADVAGEHQVSLDTVKAQITSDAKAKLDGAVADEKLTQAQADKMLTQLTENLDKILNKTPGQDDNNSNAPGQ